MDYGSTPTRAASGRIEAVSRVPTVGAAQRAWPVDPARATDPRDTGWPRPDPARIPIADVMQFETLVYGASGRRAGRAAGGFLPTEPVVLWAAADHEPPPLGAPPGDRIAHTLRHLHSVPGL